MLDLLDFLHEHFNTSELRTLIFEIGVDYDDILGETKQDKARELILYLQRNGHIQDLYNALEKKYLDNPQILEELENSKKLLSTNEPQFSNNSALKLIEEPVQKRRYHTLLSRRYADKVFTDDLYNWIYEVAKIPIWYDIRNLPVTSNIDTELPNAISQSRSIIFVLSKASVINEGLKGQYEIAVRQQKKYKEFRILPIRIDDCDLPTYMTVSNCIDINHGHLELETAIELLFSLYYNDIEAEFEKPEIYISRTWRENKEAVLADFVCSLLIAKGFRLIGDSKDQEGFYRKDDQERIKSIISSCGGLVAILPDRGKGTTSTPMLKEIEIALSLKVPCLTVAEPNVQLSEDLEKIALRLETESVGNTEKASLKTSIERLHEEWKKPSQPHYVFFATDFSSNNKRRNRLLKEQIQRITCMECIIGDDIKEVPIQENIIAKISHAFVMIADISEGNINTIIEAGIAIGAGLKENLHLVAKGPRRDPPFMFSDKQVLYYTDELELVGIVHRIAYRYRRRVLNYEL